MAGKEEEAVVDGECGVELVEAVDVEGDAGECPLVSVRRWESGNGSVVLGSVWESGTCPWWEWECGLGRCVGTVWWETRESLVVGTVDRGVP